MSSVGILNMAQDVPQYPRTSGVKRQMKEEEEEEETGFRGEESSKKAKGEVGGETCSEGGRRANDDAAFRSLDGKRAAMMMMSTASEQTGASEDAHVAGKGNSPADATPSTSDVDVKEEGKGGAAEDSHRAGGGGGGRGRSETPPAAEEPRRVTARGASKKGGVNRAMNSKNFLKNILPNITRLSRTEVLYDLKVMDGTARIRVDRDRSAL